MTSMPWVKIYTEMLDDPKMAELNPADKWGFVQLILLAGECDQEGRIPLSTKQIAWRLRETFEYIRKISHSLQEAGLIKVDDDGIYVVSFAKRQERSQSVKRQQWNDAQRRHRTKRNSVIDESSMTHEPVILTEESREEEIRGEGESCAHSPFDDMRILVETKTGYPIPNTKNDIDALNEFVKWGTTESDVDDAIEFFRNNGKIARGPYSLRNSIQTSIAKRTQKNGKKPYKDTKVWSEEC